MVHRLQHPAIDGLKVLKGVNQDVKLLVKLILRLHVGRELVQAQMRLFTELATVCHYVLELVVWSRSLGTGQDG